MKNWIMFILMGCLMAGCLTQGNPELDTKLAAASAQIKKLETMNREAYESFEDGTLNAAQFKALISQNREGLETAKALYEEAKASGATTTDMIINGGIGATVMRSLLHASRTLLPLIPAGPLQGLAALLINGALGGSGGVKKKKLVPAD